MKKTFILGVTIAIVILVLIISKYFNYKDLKNQLQEFNFQYEQYLDKEIYGADVTTAINKAVHDNTSKNLTKENDNYINIEIKIIDLEEDTIFTMETLYNGGMAQFVQYYNAIKFKCTNIQYNNHGQVTYLLFEQISI